MTVFQLPLINVPQVFEISLAGTDYLLTCKWNDSDEGGWVIDLALSADGSSVAANIPLIVGADLLDGLEYLGINGTLVVYTTGDDFAVPTLDNLGVQSNVYFQTTATTGT